MPVLMVILNMLISAEFLYLC